MLFRELIDDFPNDHVLKRFTGEVYYDVPRLRELFSTMKKEDWNKEFINSAINEYLTDIHLREGFFYKRANATKGIKIGDPHHDKIEKARDAMAKLLGAVSEYENFDKKMKDRSRYDYDDMIIATTVFHLLIKVLVLTN